MKRKTEDTPVKKNCFAVILSLNGALCLSVWLGLLVKTKLGCYERNAPVTAYFIRLIG